jgi:hypothetical protein
MRDRVMAVAVFGLLVALVPCDGSRIGGGDGSGGTGGGSPATAPEGRAMGSDGTGGSRPWVAPGSGAAPAAGSRDGAGSAPTKP